MKKALALAVLSFCATLPALAEEDCRLQIATSLPLTLEASGHVSVPAAIGDHPIKLLVDTGAPNSTLRQGVVDELKLNYDIMKHGRGKMFGGATMRRFANIDGFTLGNLRADDVTFLLLAEEDKKFDLQDGLLGANILGKYDVDFDFANAKMNLFLPHRCPGRVVYWTQDESAIAKVPMEFLGAHIRVPLKLDGQDIEAVLDTGANGSVLDADKYMPMFGLTPQSPGMVVAHDPRDPNPRYHYTFKTLTFQGVTVNNPKVALISRAYSHANEFHMLLGMDILRNLHLFISYKEKMLYVTSATAH